ncbi:MAG: rod shape-determining protein MreD [Candidatus Paceibacterota bacterium]
MQDKINYYIFLPIIFFLFFLETTFVAQIFYGNFPPSLVLIFLFAAALLTRSSDFLYVVFVFGFLFDIFSGINFGIFTLSFVLACIILCYLKAKFLKEESFIKIAALAISGALIYNLIYFFLLIVIFNTDASFELNFVGKKIIFDLVYAAVLTYPVMWLISKKRQ